jgi:hypothetical protein
MLNKIEVTTAKGAMLELPLQDLTNGYLVKEVTGLDPVKANIVSSSFATMDGEQYQSSRRSIRNIVIKLGLQPDYSDGNVRELRKNLYSYFMPQSAVTLRLFMEDEIPVDISGTVESFDSPSFVQEPEVTISLICFQPDFYDPNPVIITGETTSDSAEFLVMYDGTVETGFLLHMDVYSDVNEFTIFHRTADNTVRTLEFVGQLTVGDQLDISTISGAKRAYLTRDGSDSSLLYGVSPFSYWINLFPGENYLRIYAEGEPISYSIQYTTKFGAL